MHRPTLLTGHLGRHGIEQKAQRRLGIFASVAAHSRISAAATGGPNQHQWPHAVDTAARRIDRKPPALAPSAADQPLVYHLLMQARISCNVVLGDVPMSGVGATNSGLPVGYDQLLNSALHDALGRGQSVSVTATAGSSTLAIKGSGAYLFNTRNVASRPNAATFSTSPNPNRVKDTITLSAAAQRSLSKDQIALDLMNAAARPTVSNGKTAGPDKPPAASTGQAAAIQATAQQAVMQAATQTGDNSDAAETALMAQAAAYQASPAAVANFQSLLAQGQQASPADRFYATYSDPDMFQMLTTYMSDSQKASFTTAFNNHTLTIGGEADLGGLFTAGSSSTITDTAQGQADSGTGWFLPETTELPNTVLADAGLFGVARVSWTDPSNAGSWMACAAEWNRKPA
jgi:hypothetical protein